VKCKAMYSKQDGSTGFLMVQTGTNCFGPRAHCLTGYTLEARLIADWLHVFSLVLMTDWLHIVSLVDS